VTTEEVVDPLESLARLGAQRMLQAALEEEVEAYLQRARDERKGVAKVIAAGICRNAQSFWAAAPCRSKSRA
jgi:hypothetical protein